MGGLLLLVAWLGLIGVLGFGGLLGGRAIEWNAERRERAASYRRVRRSRGR